MGLEPTGDAVLGRRVLQYNADVEIGICIPESEADYFYRDGEGDEVIFVHEGEGVLETIFGTLPYRKHDYVVIPDRKSTRLNSSHANISYAVFCLKKKNHNRHSLLSCRALSI